MEFYYPSEKIKLMRKKFRVNQAELEGTNMTRAFISMMESGKRNVSRASSKALANKFNELAEKIHVNLKLDDEYFYRSPKEDARFFCENELKDDTTLTHEKLEELIKVESEFELDDLLAATYKKNGDIYIKEKNCSKAFVYLNNALGKYKELKDSNSQADIYKGLGYCKIWEGNFEDAIFFYKQAIYYSLENNDYSTYIEASHDLALAYGRLKEYDKCLNIIDNNVINSTFPASEYYLNNSKLMRANVLFETGRLDDAAKDFFELVEQVRTKDETMLGILYTNIADYYYKTSDYTKSLHYISEAQRIKTKTNKKALSATLALKSKILYAQGLKDESIMLLELAIDLAEEYKIFDILLDNYKDLVKILESNNDLEQISEKMNRLLETLDHYELLDGKRFAIYKLVEVSVLQGKSDESIKLLRELEPLL